MVFRLIPLGDSKTVKLKVSNPRDNSHFIVEISQGHVRIKEILYEGEISVTKEEIPIAAIKSYENLPEDENIATTAT